ncbi:MAG: FkbM family methyltransferase [Sphingobacteriales bacterium]|nr:MAG: FkbM family methyltransferase [Sphingobacteriales bacterium]
MKFTEFLRSLTLKQQIAFVFGAGLDKINHKLSRYEGLRMYKNLLAEIEKLGFEIKITKTEIALHKAGRKISLRKKSSDLEVFKQVFVRDEYQPLINSVIANNIKVETIIDAGSNIGLTSVKFLDKFTKAKVICLEPDSGNFTQLRANLKKYDGRTTLLPVALWHREEELYINAGFRDGQEWSRSVDSEKTGAPVKGTSLNTIIQQQGLKQIDILKIDIEGSEAAIFKEENDLSFLDITKVIALEIHDEFNCRDTIYNILLSRGFVLFNGVELTMGVNRKLVGSLT